MLHSKGKTTPGCEHIKSSGVDVQKDEVELAETLQSVQLFDSRTVFHALKEDAQYNAANRFPIWPHAATRTR